MMIPPRKRQVGTPIPTRRKPSTVEEIPFDFDARADYLTGFHKRKVQRAKAAKERDAKKEREQRIEDRKQLREQRKIDLENHVKAVNDALRKAENVLNEDNEDDEGGDAWNGLAEEEESAHVAEVEGREDEYIDEDKYTTVTVEPMALRSDEEVETDGDEEDDEEDEEEGASTTKRKPQTATTNPDTDEMKKKRIWTKEKPEKPDKKKVKKPKKSKFRYESKSERKNNKNKARLKNKAKAMERKDAEKKK